MTYAKHNDKRDANEREIIERARELGCRVVQMPRGAGFDLLILVPNYGPLPPIEVKNPRYAWNYEPAEAELYAWCNDNGVEYITLTSIADLEAVLPTSPRLPWWKRMGKSDIAAELSATFDLGLPVCTQIAEWILGEIA